MDGDIEEVLLDLSGAESGGGGLGVLRKEGTNVGNVHLEDLTGRVGDIWKASSVWIPWTTSAGHTSESLEVVEETIVEPLAQSVSRKLRYHVRRSYMWRLSKLSQYSMLKISHSEHLYTPVLSIGQSAESDLLLDSNSILDSLVLELLELLSRDLTLVELLAGLEDVVGAEKGSEVLSTEGRVQLDGGHFDLTCERWRRRRGRRGSTETLWE